MTLRIADVQQAVSAYYKLPVGEMTSHRRSNMIARPRQVAMYLARRLTPHSLPVIGQKFGGRDHSTVIHAVNKIEKLATTNPDIAKAVRSITRTLELGDSEQMAVALEHWVS